MMDGGSRILIVGGGYGGMHTALRLERLLGPGEATVMVDGPRSCMTYQPLLAEAAAGNLEPRHVVVPLRAVLRRTRAIKAVAGPPEVVSLDALEDPRQDFRAAVRVIATGPSRVTPIPDREEEEAEHHAYHR
jgi:NADH:quinone reductase (non-electrogenic)